MKAPNRHHQSLTSLTCLIISVYKKEPVDGEKMEIFLAAASVLFLGALCLHRGQQFGAHFLTTTSFHVRISTNLKV